MKSSAPTDSRRLLWIYAGLAALVWVVFGQTVRFPFLGYDDPGYVCQNSTIAAGLTKSGVVAAFTQAHARNWHPLTTLSHMADCQLFGLDPGSHHCSNVLLHTAAVLLLFAVLRAMTGALWRSLFVAALFAIHPLRAESVAWISERKDVLSAFFFVLTLGAYLYYSRRPSFLRYLCVVLSFACGLLSKPMLVTMPLLLLLLDFWPLGRFSSGEGTNPPRLSKLVFEKIPLLLLSAGSAIATFLLQHSTVDYAGQLPLTMRLGNAVVSCVVYIRQMMWPANLSAFYPYPNQLTTWQIGAALAGLVAVSALALVLRRSHPYFLVGWLWYLLLLLPVVGLVQVGMQAHADRYTYLPQIGLAIVLTWAAAEIVGSSTARRLLPLAATAIVLLLAWRASAQVSYWRDTKMLWQHALDTNPANDVAAYNLGLLEVQRGETDVAISHFQKALGATGENETTTHISPSLLHNDLGMALARRGSLDDAIAEYRKAIQLRDGFADAHSNLAASLAQKGETAAAIAEYEKAAAIPPEDVNTHLGLATLLARNGRRDAARLHFQRALELTSDSALKEKIAREIAIGSR